jgi:tetratricopeptide (TPR) repeat protein
LGAEVANYCSPIKTFAFATTLGFALAPAVRAQDLKELSRQFEQHRQAGRYAEAERLAKHALDACEGRFGRERLECTWTLNNLALVYQSQSKYADAEQLYQRALAIREKALGANHPKLASSLAAIMHHAAPFCT